MAIMRLLLILLSSAYYHSPCCFSLSSDGVLLLSFKYSILDDPNRILDSWNFLDATPCSWRGVSCADPNPDSDSGSARVVGLSLPDSQLLGSLPEDLGLLNGLRILNLSSNSFNGSIPVSLFTLPELRDLDLGDNLISGEVPDVLGGLRSLEVIDLSENALAGSIPMSLSVLENLTAVNLRGNYFSGNIPTGLNRVRVLDFSSNLLNGSLPDDFGGGSVHYFNVSNNRFSGDISPEFAQGIPENATLDFSYNNFTGEIPDSDVFLNQNRGSFAGNSFLCGLPSGNPCPIPSSPTSLPSGDQPIPPPAIAVLPNSFYSPKKSPAGGPEKPTQKSKTSGLRSHTIAAIVAGDLAGIAILAVLFLYVYRRRTTEKSKQHQMTTRRDLSPSSSSSCSSSSSESKGIAKWSCLRHGKGGKEEETDGVNDEEETEERVEKQGQLVTVDGETELELETLLKASAYILGSSGTSIIYKAVLEDGTVFAVRRVGEFTGTTEKMKDFEGHVRAVAKLIHPNLVRVRGFYWSSDEKLVIYEYVPNGSLANARHRKVGSSPRNIPWEIRLKIAKGIARGLSHIHEKKQVHGNIKPSNILLDLDMEPKISDFGLERFTTSKSGFIPGWSTRHFGSKRSNASRESFPDHSVGATPSPSGSSIGSSFSPYYPPETLRSLKPNSKWDVYSFGVILLELLTGKVIISDDQLGPPILAGLAVGLEDKTRVLRMADVAIRGDLEGKEEVLLGCLKLGYNCVSHVAQKRPTMKEALQVLEKIPTSSTPSSYYYGP